MLFFAYGLGPLDESGVAVRANGQRPRRAAEQGGGSMHASTEEREPGVAIWQSEH